MNVLAVCSANPPTCVLRPVSWQIEVPTDVVCGPGCGRRRLENVRIAGVGPWDGNPCIPNSHCARDGGSGGQMCGTG